MEKHKHCTRCGIDIHLLAKDSLCDDCSRLGKQAISALHRMQDKDWDKWTEKEREKARKNGEYYGGDRGGMR